VRGDCALEVLAGAIRPAEKIASGDSGDEQSAEPDPVISRVGSDQAEQAGAFRFDFGTLLP
jgi:hypothetical protein